MRVLLRIAVAAVAASTAAAMQAMDQNGVTFDPNAYPVDITQHLMCQSCYAAVKEFVKDVGPKLVGLKKKLSREVVVYDAIDGFCEEVRFFDYTGFPPAFRKGCNAFLDAYNADSVVEDRLVRGGSVEAQCKRVCAEVCEGFSEEQRFSEYSVDASQSDAARGRRPPGAEGGDVKVVTKTRLRDKPFAEGPAADADGDALESAAGKKKQGGRPAAPGRKAEL